MILSNLNPWKFIRAISQACKVILLRMKRISKSVNTYAFQVLGYLVVNVYVKKT